MGFVGTSFAFCKNVKTKPVGGVVVYRVFLSVIIFMLASKHIFGAPSVTVPPVLIDVPITKSFVPTGFDSNDRVQLAIGGELRNSCFKIASSVATVNPQDKTIVVKQQAYVYLGFCLMMIVPYSEVVTLGIVNQPGDYRILDGSSGKEIGHINIDVARTAEQDEFLYAPISDAYLVTDDKHDLENDPERNRLVLTGAFSNSCMEFKEIKVTYNENAIVIQPISILNSQADCSDTKVNFSKTVILDPKLKGDHLIHVRSLNGAAINKVVDFGF
jgi:hypothetical protein